jgi:OmpA-OmpF porin, OOP family
VLLFIKGNTFSVSESMPANDAGISGYNLTGILRNNHFSIAKRVKVVTFMSYYVTYSMGFCSTLSNENRCTDKPKKMKNRLFLILLFFVATQLLHAQTENVKLAIDFRTIKNEYIGDYGSSFFDFTKQMYPGAGLSIGYYLSPSFNIGLQSSFGNYGFYENNLSYFRGCKMDFSLNAQYKFNNGYLFKKDSRFYPFLSVGLGLATYGVNSSMDKSKTDLSLYPTIVTQGMDIILPLGAGIKYQLSDRIAIQYQYLYNFTSSDVHDQNRSEGTVNTVFGTSVHPAYRPGNDVYGQQICSLIFSIGKRKGTSKVDIACKYENYLESSVNVKVDKAGCPVDSVGNGVSAYLDQCSNPISGIQVDENGCTFDTVGVGY